MSPIQSIISRQAFVIIATQRSGSTLLIRSLDMSPSVFCAGEIFRAGKHIYHPEFLFPQTILGSRRLARYGSRYFQRLRVERHLRRYYKEAGINTHAVGFKVMISQLKQYETLLPTLMALQVKLFFLYRQNSFAAALSYFKARASGVYHSDRAAITEGIRTVHADLQEFRALLAQCDADKRTILELHSSCGGELLNYEVLVDDWDRTISQIGKSLGIEELRVPIVLKQLSSGPNAVIVENEPELRRQFAGYQS